MVKAVDVYPQKLGNLSAGGAAEALIEQYNDQLREIRERGLADTDAAEPLRELLRDMRDQPRITEGSVKVIIVSESTLSSIVGSHFRSPLQLHQLRSLSAIGSSVNICAL